VATLRCRLRELRVWPEAGDEFLELLRQSRWHSPPLTESDRRWLPLVIEDVVNGVDIGSHYPAFFQKLLMSSALRETFLDALDRRIDAS